MKPVIYIDRQTKEKTIEEIYGKNALHFLYGNSWAGKLLLHLVARLPLCSAAYGYWQHLPWTKRKISPFIDQFQINSTEFQTPVQNFRSFNDFFIRKLKPEARPIDSGNDVAVIPADGRYWFYQDISLDKRFTIKGWEWDLSKLIGDAFLAQHYQKGAMAIARLCPTDYHRFHFPCEGTPSPARKISGWLYSVNPIALKRYPDTFLHNKRAVCELDTDQFGKVLFIEIGATNVGSIHQTYTPGQCCAKGAEKGFFSFGASALVLLFPPGRILFDADLLAATQEGYEIRCLMGQPMGSAIDLQKG